jgi:hypothetical protein
MNGRSQMQGGKKMDVSERDKCKQTGSSEALIGWKSGKTTYVCSSMGPNGGSVTMDGGEVDSVDSNASVNC